MAENNMNGTVNNGTPAPENNGAPATPEKKTFGEKIEDFKVAHPKITKGVGIVRNVFAVGGLVLGTVFLGGVAAGMKHRDDQEPSTPATDIPVDTAPIEEPMTIEVPAEPVEAPVVEE